MAAKRLGQFLSNVTGTSGQILRVKADESGFEMVTPATIPSYSVTNKTLDRAIDCSNSNIDELANVLGTLIDDLTAIGAPGSVSQVWSSETISHPEQTLENSVRYTRSHTLGQLPDLIKVYVDYNNNGNWTEMWDLDCGGTAATSWRGYYVEAVSSTSLSVRMYRIGGGSSSIKIKAYVLGQVAQVAPFQWSSSEQVWPFEKASDGSTLYCKQINVVAFPNNGYIYCSFGAVGYKLHKVWGSANNGTDQIPIPFNSLSGPLIPGLDSGSGNVWVYTPVNHSARSGYMKMIYSK